MITATTNSLDKTDIYKEMQLLNDLKIKIHIISLKGKTKLFENLCNTTNGVLQVCKDVDNLEKKLSVNLKVI